MKMERRDIGRLGERLAQDFLRKQGFRIIDTNYRCPEGEIDIVAL
jgi:putative endonuclease